MCRGRLLNREVLFCASDTSLEEIELLFRRFLGGKSNGRADAIFCLADIPRSATLRKLL